MDALQLDIRDTDPYCCEAVMQAVRRDCEELRQRRKVAITEELVNADAPAQSSPHIIQLLEDICTEQGIAHKKMVSRAYHDSLFMARIAPIAMVFIPCHNGVTPARRICLANRYRRGDQVLAQALAKLASE